MWRNVNVGANAVAGRRKGLSVSQAAEVTGWSVNTVRRRADAYIRGERDPNLTIKAWLAPVRRGRGEERRIDEEDAQRVARQQANVPPPDHAE